MALIGFSAQDCLSLSLSLSLSVSFTHIYMHTRSAYLLDRKKPSIKHDLFYHLVIDKVIFDTIGHLWNCLSNDELQHLVASFLFFSRGCGITTVPITSYKLVLEKPDFADRHEVKTEAETSVQYVGYRSREVEHWLGGSSVNTHSDTTLFMIPQTFSSALCAAVV